MHPNDISYTNSEHLISRYIKPLGPRYYILLVEEKAAYNTLLAM
jgi:hypothetical protein